MIPLPTNFALKLAAALLAVVAVAFLLHDRNRWKAKTEHYATVIATERNAHVATVANYRAAADRARRQDAENLARVKAEQAAINERTTHDYESRIAAARARADELQRQARADKADPRGSRTAPVPGLPASAEGGAQAAGEGELSADDALIATEQAIQLDELIKWVRAQANVDPNGN